VISADPEAQGFDNPIAVRCGIEAIPFLVLVNREGIAIATHTRGEELGERLAELLGPPAGDAPAPGAGAAGGNEGTVKPASAETPAPNSSGSIDGEPTWFIRYEDDETPAGEDGQAKEADKEADTAPASESAAGEEKGLEIDPKINPYAAPAGLSPLELVNFILDMQEKPQTIQRRPGFADAIAEAADRVLATDSSDKYQTIAALAKFKILHEAASFEDEQADAKLTEFVEQMKDDPRAKIAAEVKFLQLERKVLDVDDLPLDQVPALLEEVHAYLAPQKLTDRHLRLASQTVHAINRLKDDDLREQQFVRFGQLFAGSSSKELARYGKKLAKSSPAGDSDLVGKPLELTGVTTLGTEFQWDEYRGKVVLVDFWATWCGPCRKAMPKVKALHEKLRDRRFEIVGVSLDQDLEALAQYLAENQIPWVNLSGDETQEIAKKYNVRGIPTMMLIDAQGKIVAVSHNIDELSGRIDKLLEDGPEAAKRE
jgi:thiol-disulfide isomerase/thioredoxin